MMKLSRCLFRLVGNLKDLSSTNPKSGYNLTKRKE